MRDTCAYPVYCQIVNPSTLASSPLSNLKRGNTKFLLNQIHVMRRKISIYKLKLNQLELKFIYYMALILSYGYKFTSYLFERKKRQLNGNYDSPVISSSSLGVQKFLSELRA